MESLAVEGGYQFGFSKIKKNHRFLNIAYTEGLVIVVQNEHFAVYADLWRYWIGRPIPTHTLNCCAEVSNTSSPVGT